MGATKRFFETAWELQTAFLKPHEDFQEASEKQFAAPL
jgi:hypothetical protein